ncbi:HAMP domain-containing sensor histidine kinase [Rhizobium sp. BK251]|uniref:sensor histidine kinase n=1 Tax=Rhizobium sp. BK251 TaxID=2512125 RepID=UPI0010442F65|nr:HAMP domain-containing sensor histidine kinase [Rhizobium sp. BK251]TCL74917.1 signal transduction histidine kinase [Rhizobium sp. BK251]
MTSSLRFRLAAGALVAIALALSLVWLVLGHLFEDYVADQYASEMTAIADALGARLTVEDSGLSLASEPSDPRFQIPAGGRYWQISPQGAQQPLRSRSLWDEELTRDALSKDLYCGFHEAEGPDGNAILVSAKTMSIGAGTEQKHFTIYTAFSKSEMETALESYHRPLRLMLVATGALLLFAAFLQGVIGLRPLGRLRNDVARIRAGAGAYMATDGPSEVKPLVSEINLLLAEREKAVERARARASDLAHGLKTPLTVLSHLVEGLPEQKRETALQQIELVRQRADRQLQAARMGVEQMATTSVLGISGKLVGVLAPVTEGRGIDWRVDIDPALTVQADPADVAEAIGNILDNAVRFARRRIELSAQRDGETIKVRVGDDGPGARPDDYASMLERGVSGGDDTANSGLGLAISGDIAAAYGGKLSLGRSALGGLEAVLSLPAAC